MIKSGNYFQVLLTVFIPIMLLPCLLQAQELKQLSIEEAYALTEEHYPLSKRKDLIRQSEGYTVENALKGYLPQISFSGRASYQSDVTEIPIHLPGMEIPSVNKAQYQAYAEINQTLYDGGSIKNQVKARQADAEIEAQQLEADLYQIRERINQIFFGILAVNEQVAQAELVKKDIRYGISKINAAIANGTAIKSNKAVLQAELMKTDQRSVELEAAKKAFLDMLSLFTNQPLSDSVVLIKPSPIPASKEINRPELKLFEGREAAVEIQKNLLKSRNLPKLGLFLQAGAGNPIPVNMLRDEFSGYYIGGLRLNWSLSGLYTLKNDKSLLNIRQRSIAVQRENFLFNVNLQMQQKSAEINKWKQLIESDEAVIDLRKSVKSTALIQLENGLINANDYLQEVNAEDRARQDLIVHQIRLLQAQYDYKTITGN